MDFRDILKSFDSLSEGKTTTDKGTVHKADPGGYGNQYGSDEVADQYGKPKGKVSLGKLGSANEPKRGKGRPPNPDKAKSYDSSALGKAMGMGKAPKPSGKPSVKHSLKEYFDQLDQALNEAGITVKPMQGASQIIGPDGEPMGTADIATANVIKAASEKGTLNLGSDEQMAEGGDIGKHNNATTGFDALVRKLTPKYGKEAATKIAGSQLKKMKMHESQGVAEGEGFSGAVEQKVKKALLQHYGKGTVTFSKTSNGGYFARHEDDLFGDTHSHQYDPETGKIDSAHSSSQYNEEGVAEAEAPQYFAQSSPLSSNNRGVLEGKKGVNPFAKKEETGKKKCPPMSHIKKMCQDGKSVAEICKMHPDCDRTELKQMVADCKKKLSEGQLDELSKDTLKSYLKKSTGRADKFHNQGMEQDDDEEASPYFDKRDNVSQARRGARDRLKGVFHPKEAPYGMAEGAKPDFLEKEPMKKAATDKNKGAAPKKGVNPFAKKKVKEGMEHGLQAARLEGKSHALRKMPYNCTHDDMEEARHYHDGFKEGLDECYGQMPILGLVRVGEMGQGPEVSTMASYGADDMGEAMYDELGEMDKTSYMKQQAINTPGNTFKAFGQTMRDNNVLDEFAFESLDKQLNSLLENVNEGKMNELSLDLTELTDAAFKKKYGKTKAEIRANLKSEGKVTEGMTVSISKGQQGSPDSVSVSAQDGEADQLLSIIKSAGLGLFGGEEQGFNAPQGSAGAHGGISVVDDHDGMMSLMKKLSGTSGGEMTDGGDYEDEEGHSEEDHMHGHEAETCESCGGMMEENHQCESDEQSVMGEDESENEMMYQVAEDNPPDSGADNTDADVAGNAAANSALATADAGADEEEGEVYSSPTEGIEDTTGEEAGTDALDEDDNCKKCDCNPCKCETVAESFAHLFRKIEMLSEESASEKVTKDIEYDDKKDKKVEESYANSADGTFEADIEFMTNVISGGLNKQKSTGQTTIPVISGQKNRMGADGLGNPMKESTDLLKDYMKLSGL